MRSILVLVLCLVFALSTHGQSPLKQPSESAVDRFLRYVKIDTQSQEDQTTVPSTRKQLNLANLLAKELTALGVENVRVSEFGIVYGIVPSNLGGNTQVPVVGFISHMDTSPAVSGENVNPIIHKNYRRRHCSAKRYEPGDYSGQESHSQRDDWRRHHHGRRHDVTWI